MLSVVKRKIHLVPIILFIAVTLFWLKETSLDISNTIVYQDVVPVKNVEHKTSEGDNQNEEEDGVKEIDESDANRDEFEETDRKQDAAVSEEQGQNFGSRDVDTNHEEGNHNEEIQEIVGDDETSDEAKDAARGSNEKDALDKSTEIKGPNELNEKYNLNEQTEYHDKTNSREPNSKKDQENLDANKGKITQDKSTDTSRNKIEEESNEDTKFDASNDSTDDNNGDEVNKSGEVIENKRAEEHTDDADVVDDNQKDENDDDERIPFEYVEVGEDIISSTVYPTNKNIFFLEVDKSSLAQLVNNEDTFVGRYLCAFESAAIHNPDKIVHVLIEKSAAIHKVPDFLIKKYKNLRFAKVDFDELAQNTPAEKLWNSGIVKTCKYGFYNKGNYLRFALMLKYGGMYSDTDILTLAKYPDSEGNFLVSEGIRGIASAILRFEKGHPFIADVMKNMQNDFQGNTWGYNGPHLIARTAKKWCNQSTHRLAFRWKCPGTGFKVISDYKAFPVPGFRWQTFYKGASREGILNKIKRSFAVHYWNHNGNLIGRSRLMSKNYPLYHVMKMACPDTERRVLRFDNVFR